MKIQLIKKNIKDNPDGTKSTNLSISVRDEDGVHTYTVLNTNHVYNELDTKVTDMLKENDPEAKQAIAEEVIALAQKSEKVSELVYQKFTDLGALDGRLTRKGRRILFDYEPIDPVLEKQIIKILDNEDTYTSWSAMLKFINNLYSNTREYVRNQLFSWLTACNENGEGFTITEDGYLLGYKGCERDGNGVIRSINSGFAIVNGTEVKGNVDNTIGNVVEMPKGMVQDDPSVACSTGLHIGTWEYASNFARGVILTVKFNPADVVSIPVDCNAQKLRCCRYKVVDVTDVPIDSSVYGGYDDAEDDDDDPENDYDED